LVFLQSIEMTSTVEDGSNDDSSEESSSYEIEDYYCTRPITGADHPAHQAIFICDTCKLLPPKRCTDVPSHGEHSIEKDGEENLPSCICQSCATICHSGHDVFYVGVGPCTCDCPSLVNPAAEDNCRNKHECLLAEHSEREARKLGFGSDTARKLNEQIPLQIPPVATLLPLASILEGNHDYICDEAEKIKTSQKEEDNLNQWMSNVCIDCNATLGGYTFGSFTILNLTNTSMIDGKDQDLCQILIHQTEILAAQSRDTFWMPIEDDENAEGDGNGNNGVGQRQWCDLELLAREIYKRHVQFYNLHTLKSDETNATLHGEDKKGGAEWWVQVKPAGSSRAPVDLHYDKDEVLAETFSLGSFPTLSTVTYLTGECDDCCGNEGKSCCTTDNAPTLIFPHTYEDEETQPIPMMLLSHAVKGKHLVFDGRLLHGAPGHPALRRGYYKAANAISESEAVEHSSLRVTFLVNIWRNGKPAAVNILPDEIRSKIICGNSTQGNSVTKEMLPLEFDARYVSHGVVSPSESGPKHDERIVLPFVSNGATWISFVGDDKCGGSDSEGSDESLDNFETNGTINDRVLGENDENSSGDEENNPTVDDGEKELVLVLPPFATAEYLKDHSDTIVLTFNSGNEARLVRQGKNEDPGGSGKGV